MADGRNVQGSAFTPDMKKKGFYREMLFRQSQGSFLAIAGGDVFIYRSVASAVSA